MVPRTTTYQEQQATITVTDILAGGGAGRAGACACACALLGVVLGVSRVGATVMLLSPSARTCTVQHDFVSANGKVSVQGKLRMHFPTDASAEESYDRLNKCRSNQ